MFIEQESLANEFPLYPALPLPEGVTEGQLFEWLKQVRVEGAPPEIANYCAADFRRFVYTWGLVRNITADMAGAGKCLELGANPYFSTMLMKQFTPHEWFLANYFGDQFPSGTLHQNVGMSRFGEEANVTVRLEYQHFNIEEDVFPFPDHTFDIILFCEIIEHLLMDPARVLREIRRILRPNGHLVLTTPNVSRLENVAKMIAGVNMYDPYSGYGPYGRHNREYNKHELHLLLSYLGFSIDEMFTADVHDNAANQYFDIERFAELIKYREHDLGQYIFLRACTRETDRGKLPSWLYRSYPVDQLDEE